MRPTLSIDDDVLYAAIHEARRRNVSLSEAVTDLIRAGLRAGTDVSARPAATIGRFAILPRRDEIITPEHVRKLMEKNASNAALANFKIVSPTQKITGRHLLRLSDQESPERRASACVSCRNCGR